jgi:HEAT repeat protein
MFRDFWLDKISFWIGFVASAIVWWLYGQVRPALATIQQIAKERFAAFKEDMGTSVEQRYRQDVVGLMQGKHIAASLFSLSEIAITPRLIAPPIPISPDGDIPPEDITQVAVPYLPDWSSAGAAFGVKTLSIPEALSRGANLLIMGSPGSGKTFALSHFASQVALRHPEVGEIGRLIPVMLHVGELSLPGKKGNPLDVFYNALWKQVSSAVESQLKKFFITIFEAKMAIVIIDGLDELPKEEQDPVINFVRTIQGKYPGNRYIIASSPEDISSYDSLELYPIAIAGWTMNQKRDFANRWGKLWKKYVQKQSWTKSLSETADPLLLNNWLLHFSDSHSPLLLTLKTWALYAGDLLGPKEVDALEAYLRRMTAGVINSRPALEQLAVQMTLSLNPIIQRKTAGSFVSDFDEDTPLPANYVPSPEVESTDLEVNLEEASQVSEETNDKSSLLYDEELEDLLSDLDEIELLDEDALNDLDDIEEELEDTYANDGTEKDTIKKRQVRQILPELVKTEVLVYRPDSKISFSNPVVNSYLTACGLAIRGGVQQLASQPNWSGKKLAFDFLAAKGNIEPMITQLLNQDQSDPIKRGLLSMGNWPRHAPNAALWRNQILRAMADTLQRENLPLGLRARVLTALAGSGEGGISTLFRQMLKSEQHSARWLGALGCGMIRDEKSLDDLGLLLSYDNSIFISRAACISLMVLNTNKSLELVTRALLEASEEVRRAAAEGLALHKTEGHPVLKDGAKVEDILVRRAVVFGLAIVNEPWAIEILEEVQVEDDQWVVRNAATQALEDMKKIHPSIPAPLPEIHETPWLIKFASERGLGVSPGQGGWDMLTTALQEGNEDQRLAAMDIYRLKPSEASSVIPILYQIMNGPEGDVREAAYNTLWHLAAAGIRLPTV